MSEETAMVMAAVADEDIDAGIARVIASWWHGGQWSALYSFASSGHIGTDLIDEIKACAPDSPDDAAALAALLEWVDRPITAVWSSYGHDFQSCEERCVTCIRCGAHYELSPERDDPTYGTYHAADGSEPMECSRDTSMTHGYPKERFCWECDGSEDGCEHCNHDCNCLACDS